jgi:hypothetical protein
MRALKPLAKLVKELLISRRIDIAMFLLAINVLNLRILTLI